MRPPEAYDRENLVNISISAAEAQVLVPSLGSVMVSAGDASGVTFDWVQDIRLNSLNLPSGPVGSAQLITHGTTTVTTTANLIIETSTVTGTDTSTSKQNFTKLQNCTILLKTYDIISGEPSVLFGLTDVTVNGNGSIKWTAIGVVNQ